MVGLAAATLRLRAQAGAIELLRSVGFELEAAMQARFMVITLCISCVYFFMFIASVGAMIDHASSHTATKATDQASRQR